MDENHPFMVQLTNMGFEKDQIAAAASRIGMDNLENLVVELTKEPEPENASNAQANTEIANAMDDTDGASIAAAAAAARIATTTQSTAEEQRRLRAEVDERARVAREVRIERERQEKIEKERHRRTEGKKMQNIRKDVDDGELDRQKARIELEKRQDIEARKRVKEQIESDRQARIRAREQAANPTSSSSVPVATSVPAPTRPSPIKTASDQCRIQVRYPSGKVTHVFNSSETLAAVRCYAEFEQGIIDRNQFQYSLAYPKKTFSWEDFEKPLSQLGFGASAAIVAEKSSSGQSVQQGITVYQTPTSTVRVLESKVDFDDCLKTYERVAVDFTASWCGPCKHIGPVFEELAAKYPTIQFVKVDVDDNQETAQHCEISKMPTFQFYKLKKKVAEFSGANKDNLVRLLDELK